jgi:hypothetical protein
MVEYRLDKAHPDYRRVIVQAYADLQMAYPFVKLTRVELIDPTSPTDTSMGAALPGGIIQLNAYWFAADPVTLNDAAKRDIEISAGDVKLLWHGLMVKEPDQVLSHEFGHLIEQSAPKVVQDWASLRWKAATRTPDLAPSGYALANSTEYFAEAFALFDLGLSDPASAADMKTLLRRIT